MKKKIFIGIVVLLILLGGLYFFNSGSPIKKHKTLDMVNTHLENKGETNESIKSVNPSYDPKAGEFNVYVTFKDEPNLRYNYIYNSTYDKVFLLYIKKEENGKSIEVEKGKHDSINNKEYQIKD